MAHDESGTSVKQEEGIAVALTLEMAKSAYTTHGFCVLPFHDLAGNGSSWHRLRDLTDPNICPFELVHKGDTREATRVDVARFLIDKPIPTRTSLAGAEQIVAILTDALLQRSLRRITDQKQLLIRRCQSHIIAPEGFVGKHVDSEANPDYVVSLIIAMNNEFKGGALRIEAYSGVEAITLKEGEALILASDRPHEVERVHAGYRNSLACFFASTLRPNPVSSRSG